MASSTGQSRKLLNFFDDSVDAVGDGATGNWRFWVALVILLVGLIIVLLLIWTLFKCCCRKTPAESPRQELNLEQLWENDDSNQVPQVNVQLGTVKPEHKVNGTYQSASYAPSEATSAISEYQQSEIRPYSYVAQAHVRDASQLSSTLDSQAGSVHSSSATEAANPPAYVVYDRAVDTAQSSVSISQGFMLEREIIGGNSGAIGRTERTRERARARLQDDANAHRGVKRAVPPPQADEYVTPMREVGGAQLSIVWHLGLHTIREASLDILEATDASQQLDSNAIIGRLGVRLWRLSPSSAADTRVVQQLQMLQAPYVKQVLDINTQIADAQGNAMLDRRITAAAEEVIFVDVVWPAAVVVEVSDARGGMTLRAQLTREEIIAIPAGAVYRLHMPVSGYASLVRAWAT